LLCTLASFGSSVKDGWRGACTGLGELATTPPASIASSSVANVDAHLSVAIEDIFLSLLRTTGWFMVSVEAPTVTVAARDGASAEPVLRRV
jgi:hypothetical protein